MFRKLTSTNHLLMPRSWGSRSVISTTTNMINLIPNQEKKKKIKDFYFRLTVITFFLLSFTILVAVVAILPAYFVSVTKKNFTEAKLKEQSSEPMPQVDENTQAALDSLKRELSMIENARAEAYPVSQKIVNEITRNILPGIKITRVIYSKDPNNAKKVSVEGVAQSREELLL